ncbi:hypothetical protein [Aeromicrobium sp.]|uniref:sensor histidine kinase n=1 Tax=Aeromicrobium sp. TaxID=1871063 RepID=UPI0019AB763E|nr:hypothetical protein [Aeromicrobium sp.]MBC7631300.1 hypothetical protein [Aeromicrobium sp.]
MVGVLSAAAVGGALYESTDSGAVNSALVVAVCLALVFAISTWRAARRLSLADLERGWELARALEAEQEATLAMALMKERSMMAGEIHDRLGHRLALSTVRLGQLWFDPELTTSQRQMIAGVRADLADITDEIGVTVSLLDDGWPLPGYERQPEDVISTARAAGADVEAELGDVDQANDLARDALGRILEEAIANAARHAPLAPVRVEMRRAGESVVLVVTNPLVGSASDEGVGTGLRRIRDRVARLGGTMAVTIDQNFTLTVRLPMEAGVCPSTTTAS